MSNWADGEILGFDFETTGVDRFHDVPVSFALVTLVGGALVSTSAALVDPGREIPAGATDVHGITTEQCRAEGIALVDAIELISDAVLSAGRRCVPLVGMKLDYDLTILDTQSRQLCGVGLHERGWRGPALDAVVLDRHHDRYRKGRRTLGALCEQYGVCIEHAHDAAADAIASAQVILTLASRFEELGATDPFVLHEAQIDWHREWAEGYDDWRIRGGLSPIDRRDYVWPVAPAILDAAA